MNTRIRNKKIKNKNISRHEDILDNIKKHYKIKDKKYHDGYFVIYKGICSICIFRIKEIPEWLFGIWLTEEGFKIFGEHEELIDKFKPSKTYISYENDIEGFMNEIEQLEQDKELYFVDSLTYGDALEKYDRGSEEQKEFVKQVYNNFKQEQEERLNLENNDRKFIFNYLKNLLSYKNGIKAIGVYDRNTRNTRVSPRYGIKVIVDRDVDNIIELANYLDRDMFEINLSQEKLTNEHQIRFMSIGKDVKDIKDANYKFIRR